MATSRRLHLEATQEHATVTPIELFFDLVFVFALTQVTAEMADDLTWTGVLRGMLVFALLWWSWVGYAWIGNVVRPDEGPIRVVMFAAMAAMFVLTLAIPEAFDDLPGGLHGPTVIALCYLVFRLMHLTLFWIISADDPVLRRQVIRFTPSVLSATAILLVAAQVESTAQTALWAAALAADYIGTMLGGASGWRVRSVEHFAERHGLIVIIALGESIVAIGVGIVELPISWPIVVGSVLGLTLSAGLWWTYFDVSAIMAERALADCPEADRARMARDAYSYLHLPLVGGIVLLALGMKKVLEYAGDAEHHDVADPLTGIGLYALYGGVVIYLLAYVGFKLRTVGMMNPFRLLAAAILVVLVPLAMRIPALAALAVLAAVVTVLVAVETRTFGELRYRLRHEGSHSSEHG